MDMFLAHSDRPNIAEVIDLKMNVGNLWANVDDNTAPTSFRTLRMDGSIWPSTADDPLLVKPPGKKKGRIPKPKPEKPPKEQKEGLFIREKRKRLRNLGLEYVNAKGKLIPKKVPIAVDCSKCRYKCSEHFSFEDQERIHKGYWSTGCYRQQRAFICKYVHHGDILRRRKTKDGLPSRRNVSFIYYLPNNCKLIRVCKKFFLSTLSIGEKVVEITKSKEMSFYSAFATEDKRGKHSPANKYTDEVLEHAKESQKALMISGRSISDMFQLYLEMCKKENIKHPVKFSKYKKMFNKEYNIGSTKSSRKIKKENIESIDKMSTISYQNGMNNDCASNNSNISIVSTNHHQQSNEYDTKPEFNIMHVEKLKSNQIYQQQINLHQGHMVNRQHQNELLQNQSTISINEVPTYNKDNNNPPTSRNNLISHPPSPLPEICEIKSEIVDKKPTMVDNFSYFRCFIFNLKSVLYTPCANVSSLHFTRKFCTYNLTIHDQNSRVGNCYMWNETEGRLEVDEIGTVLLEHLKSQPRNINHVSFMTDGMGDHSRNNLMATILLYAVKTLEHINLIDLKFLDSGQTEMEVDYLHNLIEKAKRDISVYSPLEWPVIIQLARKKKPIKMKFLYYKDFLDLKYLKAKTVVGNMDLDSEMKPINWFKVKWLQFRKNEDKIFFKTNVEEPFREIFVMRPRKENGQMVTYYDQLLKHKYNSQIPINDVKKNELINLCIQGVIPDLYHQFYKSIPSVNTNNMYIDNNTTTSSATSSTAGVTLQIQNSLRPSEYNSSAHNTTAVAMAPIFTHVFPQSTHNLANSTYGDIR